MLITLNFLRNLGMRVCETTELREDSFVPGVWFDAGTLYVNLQEAILGDILHEAGHLALIPARFHPHVIPGSLPGTALEAAISEYCETHELGDYLGREDPVYRAILQMGECEATAWSYAACSTLGLDPKNLIAPRKDGSVPYEEGGDEVLFGLSANAYFGINGLQAAGYTTVREFPKMRRWLAPD